MGMLDPRPVLAALLISGLPFAPACGDDEVVASSTSSTSDAPAPMCEEPPFAASQWVPFAPCGCTALSPWHDACVTSGGRCLFDSAGSVCLPSCALNDPCPDDCGAKNPCQEGCGETKGCPDYFGKPTSCDVATFDCIIFCTDDGFECPLEMTCADLSGGIGRCVHTYDNDFP